MNLYIKQRVFSLGDKFSVYDDYGEERYNVCGEVFSWGKKLHIYLPNGDELAFIKQKVFSFLPKYYVFVNGTQVAEIIKSISFFTPRYTVNGPDWQVDGDFFAHNYSINNSSGCELVSVSKRWLTCGDTYEINISQSADTITALSVVLAIDACIDSSNN